MEESVLLTIGAFARAVDLTPSALRFYDDCGLLAPAEVDRYTGYRYYSPALETRARVIRSLRDVGVPVETMRLVLEGPHDRARELLEGFVAERAELAARAASVVSDVLGELECANAGVRATSSVVNGPELAAAVRQVRPAALRQVRTADDAGSGSPLACVLVEIAGSRLDVVATNRYWMAVRTLTVSNLSGQQPTARAVLPPRGVAALTAQLEQATDVGLVLADGGLFLEDLDGDASSIETRAVPYPAHRLILGGLSDPVAHVTVDRAELLEVLDTADRVVLSVEAQPASGLLRVGGGQREVSLAARGWGNAPRVHLSAPIWRRAVEACLGPDVTLELRSPCSPVTLRSAYQPSFHALVMPTSVEE